MYENFVKLAQDGLKPVMKLAENNTTLAVSLLKSQSEQTAEMLKSNLDHFQALTATKDVNEAVQLQQKYVEALSSKLVSVGKENAATVEAALSEAGKVFEGTLADVQAHAKKTVEKVEKEMTKAAKKAA